MRIGKLEIQLRWHRRPKGRHLKVKGVYIGRKCDLCGEIVKGGTKAKHFQEKHPEYSFRCEHRDTSCGITYVCTKCNKTTGGVVGVIKHYQKEHGIISSQEKGSLY